MYVQSAWILRLHILTILYPELRYKPASFQLVLHGYAGSLTTNPPPRIRPNHSKLTPRSIKAS